MRWFWPIALLTAAFWLTAVPVYTLLPAVRWVWLILPALVAAGAMLRRAEVSRVDPRWLSLLVPAGLAAWVLPFPFRLPAVLVALALLLLGSVRFSRSLAWVGLPVGFVGLVLSAQAAVFPLLYIYSSRVHEVPWLTPFFYALARPFASLAAMSEGKIFIPQVYDVFEFPTRIESLAFFPLALFVVSAVVVWVLARRSGRSFAGFLGLLAAYAVLRYLFLMFLVAKLKTSSIFWMPLPLFLGLLPLVLLLMGTQRLNGTPLRAALALDWPSTRRLVPAFVLVAAGVVAAIGFLAFHDPGTRKQGRMLIDETHSDWEWTDREYDTNWYGRKSGYNYYSLAQYLNHFYTVESRSDSLLPETLSKYDIVLLKTPTESYSQAEMDALVDFVRKGGSLWIHGDHTNVFGFSSYLNPLVERFGMRFRYDSTYQLESMGLSQFEPPPVFAHPAVRSIPSYLFATSCTLETPLLSENQILGYALKASALDYSQTSFFPKKENQNYSYGIFVQQGGVKYGKGRVAGYTDSTCFSNFFMFIAGKPELALGTVEWLNRANRYAWLNPVLLLVGLGAIVAGFARTRSWGLSQNAALGLGAGFLGVALAVVLYDGLTRAAYPLPTPRTDFTHVTFEMEHSRFTLPIRGLTRSPELSLHTFFVWTQRVGFFPSHETTLEAALDKGDLVVIADPWRPFQQEEIDRIVRFVSRGGRLLVLFDPRNPTLTPRQLAGALGIRFASADSASAPRPPLAAAASRPDSLYAVSLDDDPIVSTSRAVGLTGGTPVLRLSDGRALLVETRIGEGRIFLFGDFFLFTDESMGHTGEWLDPRKRHISELEFWILRELMGEAQGEPFWKKIHNVP